ncbi:hypothetical protein B7494_g4754 [Chlorociboria aeruginascens]|nr:hypothetical protein B7494_g4754 [Chlorociboria aeruginascens]
MAEAAGLALSGVAIASLFTTCIELMEYFELCKSYEYDYKMACLKLSLLKSRLDFCRLTTQSRGNSCQRSEELWYQSTPANGVIRQSLQGIADILNNAELLKDKYCLRARQSRNRIALSKRQIPTPASHHDGEASILDRFRSVRVTFIRRSTTWAIRDKQKFDVLIDDLGFFVSNLEAVSSLSSSTRRPSSEMDKANARQNTTLPSSPPASPGAPIMAKTQEGQQLATEVTTSSKSTIELGHEFIVERVADRAAVAHGSLGEATLPASPDGQGIRYRVVEATDDARVAGGAFSDKVADHFFNGPARIYSDSRRT